MVLPYRTFSSLSFLIILSLILVVFVLSTGGRCVPKYHGDGGNASGKTKDRSGSFLSYYESPGKKGWWWYEIVEKKTPYETTVENETLTVTPSPPLPVPQNDYPVENRTVTQQFSSEEEVKPLEEYTYEELLYMHPEKFRKILNHYLERAVAEPTEQNLFYYFNLLDVARKKAALFASVYSYVTQKYAQYLPSVAYPVNVPGIETRYALELKEIENVVYGKRNLYGLLVFVSERCPYCNIQLRILQPLLARGVNVKIVNIDNRPDIMARFGIEMVPTIVLVHRNGNFMTITSGVTTLDSIEALITKAVQLLEGESPGRYGIYEFQKGTPLDPYEPPPLWRKKDRENNTPGGRR